MTRHTARPDDPSLGALLRARTTAPRPSSRTIPRGRLIEQLDRGTARPVTLVCAGPGCGKTQLVSHWVHGRSSPGAVAWLAVGADCNDPQRLWSLLLTALRRAARTAEPLRSLRPPADVDEPFLAQVMTAVAALPSPVVLVLEDLHEVQSPDALAGLDHLMRHLPPPLRLVLVTRADPAVALHRLRVADELTEIRQTALDFTTDEAVELFVQHGLDLAPAEVDALLLRTEGWAAGLRLAALSLQDRTDPAERAAAVARFAGDNRAVADYLVAEVLARQPAPLRRFLLHTSVVERIDASLADALTGTSAGAQSLDTLERAGALVVALDDAHGWYRYHRLFVEMCRHRLAVEEPDQVPLLHARAARWFADHDEPLEALRHARWAQDWELLGRTVVRHAGDLVFGHLGRPARDLLRRLPADAAPDDPWLACARVLAWHDEANLPELDRQLAHAGRLLGGLDRQQRDPLAMLLALVQGAQARARYDMAAAAEHGQRALDLAERIPVAQVPALPRYVAYAHLLRGKSLVWQGRLAEAEAHLWRAAEPRSVPGVPDSEDAAMLARAYLSLVLAVMGRLGEAERQAEAALASAAETGWADDVQSTSAHLALVVVHQQRGDRTACEVALHNATRVLEGRPDRVLGLARQLAGVRLLLDAGAGPAADAALAQVQQRLLGLPQVDFLVGWLGALQAEADLVGGRPGLALEAVTEGAVTTVAQPAYARVLRGRALLALGRPQQAVDAVTPVVEAGTDALRTVEAWLVVAEGQDLLRRDGAALTAFGRALDSAAPEQLLRPVLVAAPRLRALVERYRTVVGGHPSLVSRVLGTEPVAPAAPPDSLTDRELSVLQLLPTMMSNAEIADELFVSVNTVKAHLKSLYRKLGATSRRDAVLRGQNLVPAQRVAEPAPSRPAAG